MLELYQKPLSEIPIKDVSITVQSKFANISDQIITLKLLDKDTSVIEQHLDNLVYKLYNLSYDEAKIIDSEFSLSQEEYESITLG